MLKKTSFKITGITCQSCKILIETELDVLPGVKGIEVNHVTGKSRLEFDDEKISLEKIFRAVEKLGYKAEDDTEKKADETGIKKWKKLALAAFMATAFGIGYLLIRQSGLFELLAKLNEKNLSYGLIFLSGILVSFHCVGMCGGLVVAYSAKAAQKGGKETQWLPHFRYNMGRVISYASIGAILGGFGSFFGINPVFTGAITLLAGLFMVLMGLSLLTGNAWLGKIKLKTPDFIAKFLYNQRYAKKQKGPFVIGLLNGLIPCGPLQAMQLYALASGSAWKGFLSMGIFALGTVPLMFGFGSFVSFLSRNRLRQIMRISGAIVAILGILMLSRGLSGFGFFQKSPPVSGGSSSLIDRQGGEKSAYQTVRMEVVPGGFVPSVLYVKAGVPVRWVINAKTLSGCTNAVLIDSLGIKKDLQVGENVIEFTPPKGAKEIKFSCWMRMVWGKFVVTDDEAQSPSENIQADAADLSKSGSCGAGCGCGQANGKLN